jgi:hypothetical protein
MDLVVIIPLFWRKGAGITLGILKKQLVALHRIETGLEFLDHLI